MSVKHEEKQHMLMLLLQLGLLQLGLLQGQVPQQVVQQLQLLTSLCVPLRATLQTCQMIQVSADIVAICWNLLNRTETPVTQQWINSLQVMLIVNKCCLIPWNWQVPSLTYWPTVLDFDINLKNNGLRSRTWQMTGSIVDRSFNCPQDSIPVESFSICSSILDSCESSSLEVTFWDRLIQ